MTTVKRKTRKDDWTLFFERHKPVTNQFVEAPYDGAMFETYGEEFEFVKKQSSNNLFTLVEAEGKMYACPGFHFVNRLGYFVVSIPWTAKQEQRTYKL